MKGTKILEASVRYLKHHSPIVLSALGAVGVVTTAVMAAKATPKAMERLEIAEAEKRYEELTKLETVLVAGPVYIPAILTGAATIACIFGASIMSHQQQRALTSAYIFLDRSFKEYKDKVNELYGENADREVRASIAKGKLVEVNRSVSDEHFLFYEEHYGQFFERTMLEVQDAEYQLNRKFAQEGEVSLNDFFEFLGLSETEIGDALGWSQEMICDFYNPAWIDFEHELVQMEDGMECYIISILVTPTAGYDIPF